VIDEVGWGLVDGIAAGALGAIVLTLVERHRLVAHDWLQVIPLSSAALSYAIAAPLGGSGFIAALVAGLMFGVLYRRHGGEITYLVDVGGQVLNAVTFIVFGAIALGLAGLGARRPTVAFVGWFGPRGLASIVFAIHRARWIYAPTSTSWSRPCWSPSPFGVRARTHRFAAHECVRTLVHRPTRAVADGEHIRLRAPLATSRRYSRPPASTG
jgi:NhaP-type Na+/H+ and K+/H+ antiporter